jgi:hypothetical protein
MALSLTGLYYFLVEYCIGAYFNIYNQLDLSQLNGLNNLSPLKNYFVLINFYDLLYQISTLQNLQIFLKINDFGTLYDLL